MTGVSDDAIGINWRHHIMVRRQQLLCGRLDVAIGFGSTDPPIAVEFGMGRPIRTDGIALIEGVIDGLLNRFLSEVSKLVADRLEYLLAAIAHRHQARCTGDTRAAGFVVSNADTAHA
ncbi:hypothetical protein CAP38_10115 [Hydrogenophaga sp. IBVHS2]|nr:hypothetical protein CAP38_10115 [Hydrogenophaga sp. IBVHS2]